MIDETNEIEWPPPCPACNGYGNADGQPSGTWARDFGPEAPGPCPACDGTGDAPDHQPTPDR